MPITNPDLPASANALLPQQCGKQQHHQEFLMKLNGSLLTSTKPFLSLLRLCAPLSLVYGKLMVIYLINVFHFRVDLNCITFASSVLDFFKRFFPLDEGSFVSFFICINLIIARLLFNYS